ncbi:hypothetical protein KEM54_006948 [Ascosphaera aggregata]|nr:hypothetical protein KEM54_006948 [Ascosphaera aggregata]
MAQKSSSGYVAASSLARLNETSLPIFSVERVQLKFSIAAEFVAAQVANNVLVLALASGRVLRIDLDNAEDIDDIDVPKKSSEIGLIRRMFLDPSASHLIITTTLGENYYLHTQSRQPKHLPRLKGVVIESVAWNPSLPTASTREILIGASDGTVYEAYIEPATEFYRRDERYVTSVYQMSGSTITGIWMTPGRHASDVRHVLISTHDRIVRFTGKVGKSSGSIFTEYFQRKVPATHALEGSSVNAPSTLAIRPQSSDHHLLNDDTDDKSVAWLSGHGVLHGIVQETSSPREDIVLENTRMLPRSMFPESLSARGGRKLIQDPISAMTMTEWHILVLVEGRVMAINRLSGEVVFDQAVLEPRQAALGLFSDLKKCTYWLITAEEIFEVAVSDESRDIWKTLLKENEFEAALRYARSASQKDAVATASGDYLAKKGQYLEAAAVWGKSSKNFEEVCLTLLENDNHDALRTYLQAQLSTLKKSNIMQRMLIASWLVEAYMSKLNELSDSITTKNTGDDSSDTTDDQNSLEKTRCDFREFVTKYKADLDPKTVYDIIGCHGREEELLFFATCIDDSSFVLTYWIQREKWGEALDVLKKQTDPQVFYKYSTVLAVHTPTDLVDILMRHMDLDPEKLIPALLAYNKSANVPLNKNQAVRYLNFIIANHFKPSAAVHDTLISIYASHPSRSETALLKYLASQPSSPPPYDADFALRLCIQHNRVQSCVHIYSAMGQYTQAVELALKNDDIELAALIADRPEGNDKLRKKLWLLVAEKKIRHSGTEIKKAIQFLRRCELLRIEDLIPFFPDFVVVDDFKEEICTALEDYSRHIDSLRQEMDDSARSAEQIRNDIAALNSRYVIVEPGEKCWICFMPLLSRQFFVFPCQHAFHSDCLGKKVLDAAGKGKRRHIKDLQAEMNCNTISADQKEQVIEELDGIIAEACSDGIHDPPMGWLLYRGVALGWLCEDVFCRAPGAQIQSTHTPDVIDKCGGLVTPVQFNRLWNRQGTEPAVVMAPAARLPLHSTPVPLGPGRGKEVTALQRLN